jgi:lipopolysaccharide transport system ATP-binding protein
MPDVIKVEGLGKKFIIGHESQKGYTTFREAIMDKLRKNFNGVNAGKNKFNSREEFWALKEIDFEIRQGDRIGIIGRNGAGKSTLLKILSKITEPTTGRVSIKGRVASLLEVGTGFHPELTGGENIFLNGAILGMSRSEVKKKFDKIIDFAEVEKFLDTPVKRYSSGMYVRLAFAVAAHLDPEILLVDEVLAVGDAQFQKKCLGKMGDVSEKEGRTILFVSHNMDAIKNLCNKCLLLDKGELIFNSDTRSTISKYLHNNFEVTSIRFEDQKPEINSARLVYAKIFNLNFNKDYLDTGDDLVIETKYAINLDKETNIDVTMHIMDEMNNFLIETSSAIENEKYFKTGFITAKCILRKNILHEGVYYISRLLLVKDRGIILMAHENVLSFRINDSSTKKLGWMGERLGLINPKYIWEIES